MPFIPGKKWALKQIPINIYRLIFMGGIVGVCLSWPYFNAYKKANEQWASLQMFYHSERFDVIAEASPMLFPALRHDPQYLFEYGRSLHMIREYEKSNEILGLISKYTPDPMALNLMGNNYKALGESDLALGCYQLAHYYLPNRIYPLYLMARLYRDDGDEEAFLRIAVQIIDFDPKIESSATVELKKEIKSYYMDILGNPQTGD